MGCREQGYGGARNIFFLCPGKEHTRCVAEGRADVRKRTTVEAEHSEAQLGTVGYSGGDDGKTPTKTHPNVPLPQPHHTHSSHEQNHRSSPMPPPPIAPLNQES